ncbi:hypothetical protein DSO57_1039106 [Entomophthora muscae]|uniref:Uncharacterized protein n=1 Tax=Entomophthora muscae TaxID=34485 RepID=A0ACC2SN58_9FUNG|nr:hypothetical protein DSO57_1039106 [Entomophthora muscae]
MQGIFLLIVGVAWGHSWLDCIGKMKKYRGPVQFFSNDFYKEYCKGFGRGYPGRFNRNINDIYTTIIEGRGSPDPKTKRVCGETAQTMNYTKEFPMASVVAGRRVKLWYEMDAHMGKDTTVNIIGYGVAGKTIDTYADQLKAKKLFTHPFATPKNCIDMKFVNTWCWAYFKIPANWPPGVYSFLWNWPWDGNPIGEEYNTCFDLNVTPYKPRKKRAARIN